MIGNIIYFFWFNKIFKVILSISTITNYFISKSIKESNLPKEIRIGAIVRKKEVIIPKSNFVFEKKDLVVFLTKREHLEKVESLFRISSLI